MQKPLTRVPAGVLLLAVCFALSSCRNGVFRDGYRFDRQGKTAERRFTGAVASDVRSIIVENQFGSVSVAAEWETIGWEWELTCWGTTQADADRFLQEIELVTEQKGTAASWRLVLPQPPVPRLRGVESNLILKVPPGVSVSVTNRHGPTTIVGIGGTTSVRSRHGSVSVRDLTENLSVSNAHGDVRAERISGGTIENEHGTVRADSVEGDLTVRNRHGAVTVQSLSGHLGVNNAHGDVDLKAVTGSAEATTSHASIRAEGISEGARLINQHGSIEAVEVAKRLEVRTAHGRIKVATSGTELIGANEHSGITAVLTNPAATLVSLETEHGDIDLTLPDNSRPRVTAKTSHGRIDSRFPARIVNKERQREAIEAGPADATLRVKLSNSHGDITVR